MRDQPVLQRPRRLRRLSPLMVVLLLVAACSPVTVVESDNYVPTHLIDVGDAVWSTAFSSEFFDPVPVLQSYDKATGEVTTVGSGGFAASDFLPFEDPSGTLRLASLEADDMFGQGTDLITRTLDVSGDPTNIGPATRLERGSPALVDGKVWYPGRLDTRFFLAEVDSADLSGGPTYNAIDGRVLEFAKPPVPGASSPFFIGHTRVSLNSPLALYELFPSTGFTLSLSGESSTMEQLTEVQGTHSLAMVTAESGTARLELVNPDDPTDRVVPNGGPAKYLTAVGDTLWFAGQFAGERERALYGFNTVTQTFDHASIAPGTGPITSLGVGEVNGSPIIYFGAGEGTLEGNELYRYDPANPTNCGFGFCSNELVADINPGPDGSDPAEFLGYDNNLLFSAYDGTVAPKLHLLGN